jgi:RNA polymerase sigma-70 factor (ECF subfamily)
MNMDYSNISDEELVKLVVKGDTDKFGILMERYQSKLFRYGRKFLVDKDNIEDVVQDIFIKTYKNLKSFDTNLRFSPWIYRIAHNTYINAIKKNSLNPLYLFDFDTLLSYTVTEDPVAKEREQKEIKEFIDKGLESIEDKYREILVLYYIEEFSYKEIADILEIPISTVGVRILRAKNALKQKYKELKIEI